MALESNPTVKVNKTLSLQVGFISFLALKEIMPRNLLLISSSRVHGFGFLENVADTLSSFLKK